MNNVMKIQYLIILLMLSSCSRHKTTRSLQLIKAYEVETLNKFEPSGLTLWDGEFYTVSDKHNTIFHLKFNQDSISLEPIVQITGDDSIYFDFEGISHDDEYFYLISERNSQIMKVSQDGQQQMWLPADTALKQAAQTSGLLQKQNAYFESLCYLSKNHFLLAAERDPRGFIEVRFSQNRLETADAYLSNESKYASSDKRSNDFTGLSCEDGVYVLERNAYVVSSLKKHGGKFHESRGWSYQHIIDQPELLYQDMKYGHAEGLVVKGDKIYIILDNNKNPHQQNPKNNNSLFLELQM